MVVHFYEGDSFLSSRTQATRAVACAFVTEI